MRTLHGWAPAKINLGLCVLERRADGYHEVRTVLQTISLADRLSVSHDPGGEGKVALKCSDASLAGPENLAARAARELLAKSGGRGSVSIRLEKRIPAGSGLGGGSSDAAAVLLALGRLLRPRPSAPLLYEVAAGLGSDVPFFLLGGRAAALGRGEEVYPLPDPPRQRCLLLLIPGFRVATSEAYQQLSQARSGLTPAERRHIISVFCSTTSVSACGDARDAAGLFSNDFEAAVLPRFPQLSEWKDRLVKAGAVWAMLSGSGSALFGVFPDRHGAAAARGRFVEDFPGEALIVREMSRTAYSSLWGA
jgi:4-diphosphocytidyl-2-C-methyl-D-erythritol kinase